MKLLATVFLTSLAVVSLDSHASNNTYVYSNTEYCELAQFNSTAAHLDAYGRKLGYKPSVTECRQLLATPTEPVIGNTANVKQLLRDALRGSTIRPNTTLARKISLLPEQQRQQALNELFGR